ncbi:MAG: hypothetical protein JWM56_827 [Candidatus Peribacteria bacterium]|nr:hypothetical protein [Candidatus Peribacteria bacterium]
MVCLSFFPFFAMKRVAFPLVFVLCLVACITWTNTPVLAQGTDTTKPVSTVNNTLGARQTSLSFPVSVTGSDPGSPSSGVSSYDIYVAVGAGAFNYWTTVSAGSPSTTFTAVCGVNANNSIFFYSIAHDNAGNVEVHTTAEASTFMPDFCPPASTISAINSSSPAFALTFSASDFENDIRTVDLYAGVDGAAAQQVTFFYASGSVVNKVFKYPALADGVSHTYSFYTISKDTAGNTQLTPASGTTVTATFATATIRPLGISINNGFGTRSYVRYIKIPFTSQQNLGAIASRVRLTKFTLDGMGATIVPISSYVSQAGQSIVIDFGATDMGAAVPAGGSITSRWQQFIARDGYFQLAIDTRGNGRYQTVYYFHHLLGDVDGNGQVTQADQSYITKALSRPGSFDSSDVDLSGAIDTTDTAFLTKSKGRLLSSSLKLTAPANW